MRLVEEHVGVEKSRLHFLTYKTNLRDVTREGKNELAYRPGLAGETTPVPPPPRYLLASAPGAGL